MNAIKHRLCLMSFSQKNVPIERFFFAFEVTLAGTCPDVIILQITEKQDIICMW